MEQKGTTILEPSGTEIQTSAGGARRYRKPLKSFRWCDIQLLLSDSLERWSKHKAPRLGAALAFYTLLSLTPLLLVVVSILGLLFGQKAAESDIVQQVRELIGPQGAKAIGALLEGAQNKTHGVMATIFGLLMLLFGASGVIIELRDALNTIWDVPAPTLKGLQTVKSFIKERLFSFALVAAIGFVLLVSLAVNAFISAVGALSASVLPAHEAILHAANSVVSFIIIAGLFAAIYKIMPDVRIEWREVVLGAAVTSFLFTIGKLVIGIYLGKASFASTYGAATSVVVFIIWVYYSAQIFFFGAEFTKAFADRYGSVPSRHPEGMVVDSTNTAPALEDRPKIITPAR